MGLSAVVYALFCLTIHAQENISISSSPYYNASANINITYPYENMPMQNLKKTFVFGTVSPSTGIFSINGEKVQVYKNGSFLAYVSVKDSSFFAQLFDGYSTHTYLRKVSMPSKESAHHEGFFIDLISPGKSMELLPAESFIVYAKATAGLTLLCKLSNGESIAMKETPSMSGNYYGVYTTKEKDAGKELEFSFRFKRGIFSRNLVFKPSVSVKVLANEYQIKTSTNYVVLKNSPGGGYTMFLPEDVVLKATGKIGGNYRVNVGGRELWVDESKVSFYSPYPKKNNAETGNLVFLSSQNTVSARLSIQENVPYLAYAIGNNFYLDLYYCNLRTNWVIYDSSDPYTVSAFFRQNPMDTASFTMSFSQQIKGYDIEYSTNLLVINFKFAPRYSGKYPKPLEGVKIVLDPGHSPKRIPPFDGAVSPSFYFEYEANMAIALKLKEKLLNLGADVYLTRNDQEIVELIHRPILAKKFGGDIFISIHNNALPDGEDPFSKPRGFSVYYYHPNSMAVAKAIHSSFLKNINLADEGLRYGDYHVIRQTFMPAVLIENAYMIIPEHEEFLKSEQGLEKLSQAISDGILSYFNVEKQNDVNNLAKKENARIKKSAKNN